MKAKKCSLFSFHWPVEVHTRRHADMHTKLDIRIRVIRNELLNWPVRIQSRITRCRRLRKIHKIQFDNCSSTAAPHGMAWHGTNWNWNTSNLIENFIKINQIAERQSALAHIPWAHPKFISDRKFICTLTAQRTKWASEWEIKKEGFWDK